MTAARFIIGDTRTVVASLPAASVDLVLTSPPFLALRSYLPADHPDKGSEIGSEGTPAAFLAVLLDLAQGWRRVLAPHGSICVELGDTYSGSNAGGKRSDGGQYGGWPLPKSLCMIPQLFAASLSYGRNMLEPTQTFDPWRVRNVIRWVRPNPPVGALGDKFRPATSEMTVACMSRTRWFDLDAVREPSQDTRPRNTNGPKSSGAAKEIQSMWPARTTHKAGAPPLDWWKIPARRAAGSHYATWPPALCVKPIKAMCPERVCTTCGEPSRRIVEAERVLHGAQGDAQTARQEAAHGKSLNNFGGGYGDFTSTRTTVGWTDCGCSADGTHWRAGVVLDPFGGTGTTGMVATSLGRDAILIDIDARNLDLARARIGTFLTAEGTQ